MAEIKFYRDAAHEHQVYPSIDPDGNYPGVVVGLADNLINHNGITYTSSWNWEVAGGTAAISDGYAELLKLKGNASNSTITEWIHVNILPSKGSGVQQATVAMSTFANKVQQQSKEQMTYNFYYTPVISVNSEFVYNINKTAFANAVLLQTGNYVFTLAVNIETSASDLVASLVKNTFAQKVDMEPGVYEFTYNGSNWLLNEEEVDLALYGIATSELETEGSSFSINYVANNWTLNGNVVSPSSYGLQVDDSRAIPGSTFTIEYTANQWQLNGAEAVLSQYGITITEGSPKPEDDIQIVYQPEDIGHIHIANPTGIKTIGMNQFNLDDPSHYFENHTINSNNAIVAGNGYVVYFRCLGGNTYTIYNSVANAVTKVCYVEDEPSSATTGMTALSLVTTAQPAGVTVTNTTTVRHYTPSANGYLVIATTDIEDLCCHITKTGAADTTYETYWEHEFYINWEDENGNIITTYGVPMIVQNGAGTAYYDELDTERREYYKRVDRIEYSAANLATIQGYGKPYMYDDSWIYYGIDTQIYHISQDENFEFKVSEYGTAELIGTDLPMEMTILYEDNLKAKLRDNTEVLSNKTASITSSSTSNEYPSASAVWALDQALRKILGLNVNTFSTTSTYAVRDYVVYNLKLWRCKTAVTRAGAWTGTANWEESYLFKA